MKLLLIVGTANDIFIYNYAKWLKKSMDVTIDVFEFYPSTQQGYNNKYYDSVTTARGCGIPWMSRHIDCFIQGRKLSSFLRGKQYDIIHCHWIIAPLVLANGFKNHCRYLVATFWGREYANIRILGSNARFRKHLYPFVKEVDALINSGESQQIIRQAVPMFDGKFYEASFGSAPVEELYSLMEIESRNESKRALDIPEDKFCTMIGYSAKWVHQHLAIIEELSQYHDLKQKLHLLVPMTRGGSKVYIEKVRKALNDSGYTYTLIEGRYLSDIEVARLRNSTDIVLQLSESDGFSRSIVECLCAKSIMIYGAWLGYNRHLQSAGFAAISVESIKDGIEKTQAVIDNIDAYKDMVSTNYENGKQGHFWSVCIKDWVNAYNDLLK